MKRKLKAVSLLLVLAFVLNVFAPTITVVADIIGDYKVSFNGPWVIGGVEVDADRNGTVTINAEDEITLTNFNSATMQGYIVASDGFSADVAVDANGKTKLSNADCSGLPANATLEFKVVAKKVTSNITVSAGSGTYQKEEYDWEEEKAVTVNKNYDDDAEILINGERWNHNSSTITYTPNNSGKVDITFETLWIGKFYGDVEINGTAYKVSDYLNWDDRDSWLNANKGSQTISFVIPNVDVADDYDIVVRHGDSNSESHFANFLWTADPSQKYRIVRDQDGDAVLDENGDKIPGDDYIGNSKIEFVKAVYKVANVTYTVTKDDLIATAGRPNNYHSEDEFLSFASDQSLGYDEGALTLPDQCYITMRVVPDYGYQVTEVNGGENFTTTDSGVSEFTLYLPDPTNGYFTAEVEAVDNTVTPTSEKVKSGEIELGENAAADVKNGTVRLSVDDIELTSDKIADFEEEASKAGDYTITSYLDINLEKVLYRGTEDDVWAEQIHHLTDKALITLQLEEGVDASNIVIVHNINNGDEFEIIEIESYDEATNTITFYTDSFSNYAIATKTSSSSSSSTSTSSKGATTSNPNTGDNIMMIFAIFAIAATAALVTMKLNKKRRVRNH